MYDINSIQYISIIYIVKVGIEIRINEYMTRMINFINDLLKHF